MKSRILKNRLLSAKVLGVRIMYGHKNWKKNDASENCSLTVQSMLGVRVFVCMCVCVIVMKLSVEISLSNVELTRNYMQEREKNKK